MGHSLRAEVMDGPFIHRSPSREGCGWVRWALDGRVREAFAWQRSRQSCPVDNLVHGVGIRAVSLWISAGLAVGFSGLNRLFGRAGQAFPRSPAVDTALARAGRQVAPRHARRAMSGQMCPAEWARGPAGLLAVTAWPASPLGRR